MLEFAESVLKEVRKLQEDSEAIVLNGSITDMERYRFLMGRLEGIKLVDQIIREKLDKHSFCSSFFVLVCAHFLLLESFVLPRRPRLRLRL